MTDASRPQDQGRRHRRKGAPSPATASLLAEWHTVLRAEMRQVVDAMAHGPFDDPVRDKLIDRGIKVARELGTEVDAGVTAETPDAGRPSGSATFGPD